MPDTLDEQMISDADDALDVPEKMQLAYTIRNTHRSIGAKLSSRLTRRFGMSGLPPGYFTISLRGSAGQSLGAWAVQGLKIVVIGDANDYVGKGLSGGTIVVRLPTSSPLNSSENTIIGNVVLYGATSGKLFAAGQAGERFCVRNSGARAVVEGCGSNGCEYMTGGIAVILGPVGDNFAAGMDRRHGLRLRPGRLLRAPRQRRHGDLAAHRQQLLGERMPGPGRGAPCRDQLALQRAAARRLDPGDRQFLADLPARDDLPPGAPAFRRGEGRDRLSGPARRSDGRRLRRVEGVSAGDDAFRPPDDSAALRQERWRVQRAYVADRSPFFARLWAGRRVPERLEDLPALPLCDKAMLRESQAAHPPFGDYLAAVPEFVVRLHRTSGTTGQAMNIAQTGSDAAQTAEVGARCFQAAGLTLGTLTVHCLNYRMWMGGVSDHLALEAAGATVIPFGVGDSALLIRTILDLRVAAIHCTPSYPAALERTLAEHFPGLAPRDLGLRLGLFGGEAGLDNPSFRERLENRLGLHRAQCQLRRLRRVQQFREPVLGRQRPALPGRGRPPCGADRAGERRSRAVAGGRARRAGADPPAARGPARWCASAPAT